ncbi:hypothetical protein HDV02_003425 [Globomyces sp. JEL0801]|nr:hypothetical protein HDV02_003425 [Globomyces sp. JEL0801]
MASQWQANPMPLPSTSDEPINELSEAFCIDTLKRVARNPSILPPFDVAPKHIVSRTNNLSIELQLFRNLYVTNGVVEGQLRLHCHREGLTKLGRVSVYLIGLEENLTDKKIAPRVFLTKEYIMQDLHLVPSDAVTAGPADEHGMWSARKGTTCFDFSLPFVNSRFQQDSAHIRTAVAPPSSLPSSYWHPKAGGIRYILAAVAECKFGLSPRYPLAYYQEIFVVESVPFSLTNEFDGVQGQRTLVAEKTDEISSGFLGLGKKGKINLTVSIRTQGAEGNPETGVWASGGIGYVGVEVTNDSARKVIGMNVKLIRKIKTFATNPSDFDLDVCGLTPISFSKRTFIERTYSLKKKQIASPGLEIRDHSCMAGREWVEREQGGYDQQEGFEQVEWEGVEPNDRRKLILDLNLPPIEVELPVTLLHPSSFLKDVPSLKVSRMLKSDSSISEIGNHRMPSPYTVPEVIAPQYVVADPVEEPVENEVFASATTLHGRSNLSISDKADEDDVPLKKAATISTRSTSKFTASKAFRTATLGRRPPIAKPSPAAIRASLNGNNLNIPPPPTKAPSIVNGPKGSDVSLTEDYLKDTPRMDLGQEIDKLLACVQMD